MLAKKYIYGFNLNMYINAVELSENAVKSIVNQGKIGHCCFLASVHALGRSTSGEKIIKNNIQTLGDKFIVRYADIKGKERFFEVTKEDFKKYLKRIKFGENAKVELTPFRAIAASWDKAVQKFPSLKNIFIRMAHSHDCAGEWNTASNFMKSFTGEKPISVGDKFVAPLFFRLIKANKLLNKMVKLTHKDYSFVVGTGGTTDSMEKTKICTDHYYSVLNVTKKDITLSDPGKPTKEIITITRKELMNNFRSICGYFWKAGGAQ